MKKKEKNLIKLELSTPVISPERLVELSKYKKKWIRRAVAQHANTPGYILRNLLKDKDPLVQYNAVSNPNVSMETLRDAAFYILNLREEVKRRAFLMLAQHPDVTLKILNYVALAMSYPEVISEIISHPKTSINTLYLLAPSSSASKVKIKERIIAQYIEDTRF